MKFAALPGRARAASPMSMFRPMAASIGSAPVLQEPVLSKALTRFTHEWRWDGKPALLQSRAVDETGFVQPTIAELRAVRGVNGIYNNNSIQTWQVKAGRERIRCPAFLTSGNAARAVAALRRGGGRVGRRDATAGILRLRHARRRRPRLTAGRLRVRPDGQGLPPGKRLGAARAPTFTPTNAPLAMVRSARARAAIPSSPAAKVR